MLVGQNLKTQKILIAKNPTLKKKIKRFATLKRDNAITTEKIVMENAVTQIVIALHITPILLFHFLSNFQELS